MNAWWRCGTCDAYVLQSEQTCPMCELSGRPDFAFLERRIESLEARIEELDTTLNTNTIQRMKLNTRLRYLEDRDQRA